VTKPPAGLLLAAGAGRRYGMPKALVRHGDHLLVEHALRTLETAGCTPLVVVLGAAADQVQHAADLSDATVVVNPDWETGMGSSLRAGLAALQATAAASTIVLLVDTPGITAAAVGRVAGRSAPDALAVATYQGVRGHPVLLGRDHWAGVGDLATGDVGAKPYLAAHSPTEVPCDDVAHGTDLDVPR
jgi:nicotine blue oxidoreductase